MIGYFDDNELRSLGFRSLGKNVRISKTTTIYNVSNVSIGDNVRIDNFCTLAISGVAQLTIGNHVHISAYNFMNGLGNISIEDFVTTAPYVRIFSSTDDYSGTNLTGATIDKHLLGTYSAPVSIKRHAILGVGSSVMPGVTLGVGVAVGAHSFVRDSFDEFTIVAGVPAKRIGLRERKLLDLEKFVND